MTTKEKPTDVQFHEIASLFPLMSDEELGALVEDVRAYGIREPIRLAPPVPRVAHRRKAKEPMEWY